MPSADRAEQNLFENVREGKLNAENWFHKRWKPNRGCWGHSRISKSKESLLPPARGTQGVGGVTKTQGPGPSTGNRMTMDYSCRNQRHRGATEALPRREREGEEDRGFSLPLHSNYLPMPPVIKLTRHPDDLGAWKYSLRELAPQRKGKEWSWWPTQALSVGWINMTHLPM